MTNQSIDPQLLSHLKVEFGLSGARAVEFLSTASKLFPSR